MAVFACVWSKNATTFLCQLLPTLCDSSMCTSDEISSSTRSLYHAVGPCLIGAGYVQKVLHTYLPLPLFFDRTRSFESRWVQHFRLAMQLDRSH